VGTHRVNDPAIIELAIVRQQGQLVQPPDESAVTEFVQDILHRLHEELVASDAQPPEEPASEQQSIHGF
jgi:hypothetical protein